MSTPERDLPPAPRPSVRRRVQVAEAALRAGHELSVVHEGRRFRLACSCGYRTPLGWTRKHAFQDASDHVIRAGRTALGESPLLGEVPPVRRDQVADDVDTPGVSLPATGKINL